MDRNRPSFPLSLLIPVLSLALVLCACSSGSASSSQPPDGSPGSASLTPTPDPQPDPEPEPEPEPEPVDYNPLTGQASQTELSGQRPVAVMLNNLKKALPQLGVSQADIIYEMPAEGGITRMMALYQSLDGVGEIGSVRSARDYYVSLALGHDAIFLHAGGSPQAYTFIKSSGVTALDCVNGPYEGTLFWRDPERKKNMGLEHSVLTSGETIQTLLPTYSRVKLEHKEGFEEPLVFQEEPRITGESAQTVTVKFSSYKTGVFRYDAASGLYRVEEYDAPYVDGNTGEQVAVRNVLILFTDVSAIPGDTAGRLSVRTTGTGAGYLALGGKVRAITWSRADAGEPMSYLDENGDPLVLGVGSSYVNIVSQSAACTFQ